MLKFKIKRQDSKDSTPYWEDFTVPYKSNSNVISCLMDIQANPVNSKGEKVSQDKINVLRLKIGLVFFLYFLFFEYIQILE